MVMSLSTALRVCFWIEVLYGLEFLMFDVYSSQSVGEPGYKPWFTENLALD